MLNGAHVTKLMETVKIVQKKLISMVHELIKILTVTVDVELCFFFYVKGPYDVF